MTNLFENTGLLHGGVRSLSPREVYTLTEKGLIIVDLRHPDYLDYKAFDRGNVINIPADQFEKSVALLDPEKYYVLADASGIHNHAYTEKMQNMGFRNVASMSGGFLEWERDGMPVLVNNRERLTGSCACQLKPREHNKTS